MDLVRLIMEQLSPQLIGRIASALGLDPALAQKAVAAAVPALLSGLVSLVSKPEGASRLATILQQQEPSQVDRTASMIGSGNPQALVDQGTNTLSSLFGNSTLNSLSGALGRFAGTGRARRNPFSPWWHRLRWACSEASRRARGSMRKGSPIS